MFSSVAFWHCRRQRNSFPSCALWLQHQEFGLCIPCWVQGSGTRVLPQISSSPKPIKLRCLVFLNHKNLFCFCRPNVRIERACQDAWLLGKWPFLFRNWAFGCSADTKVRSLSWGGGLNSPALTVFWGNGRDYS